MIVSVCLEIVLRNIGARFVPNIPLAHKSLWTYPMELLGDVGLMEFCCGPFGDSVSVDAR